MNLPPGVANADHAPADHVADVLRADGVEELAADQHAQAVDVHQQLVRDAQAFVDSETAVEIGGVYQLLPTGRARSSAPPTCRGSSRGRRSRATARRRHAGSAALPGACARSAAPPACWRSGGSGSGARAAAAAPRPGCPDRRLRSFTSSVQSELRPLAAVALACAMSLAACCCTKKRSAICSAR